MIFESCACRCKGEGEFKEPTQTLSHSKKPEDQTEGRAEGGRGPACGSWRRWMLGLLPFFPFTAAVALTLHYLTREYICLVCRLLISCKKCVYPNLQPQSYTAPVSDLYLSSPAPPSSVFFLGGSVEFPNLSFSSELTDPTSPQFRLQAQALNHYVSATVDLSVNAFTVNDTLQCCSALAFSS